MHVDQPPEAAAAIRRVVEQVRSPLALAALHVMTALTGSVLVALAYAAGRFDADRAWDAAHVDETYQESIWGEDQEAMVRRGNREADFRAASLVYRLAEG
jgi:chaperone required for assembly of F1-ATPase